MKNLEPFDYQPSGQEESENPVVFTLKPLDTRGRFELEAAIYLDDDQPKMKWDGVAAGARYIVGWKGGSLGEFSASKLRKIVDGEVTEAGWHVWLARVAVKLYVTSKLSEIDEKKS